MDHRDEALLALLEAGEIPDDVATIQLINILSTRSLGPGTIDGVSVADIRTDDPRYLVWRERKVAAEWRAFELIKAYSRYYREDRWPADPPPSGTTFRSWVDHRIQRMIDRNKFDVDVA